MKKRLREIALKAERRLEERLNDKRFSLGRRFFRLQDELLIPLSNLDILSLNELVNPQKDSGGRYKDKKLLVRCAGFLTVKYSLFASFGYSLYNFVN